MSKSRLHSLAGRCLLTGFVALTLAACGSLPAQTDRITTRANAQANGAIDESVNDALHNPQPAVEVSDGIYVDPDQQPILKPLPAVFHQKYSITLASVVPLSFAADRLTQLTGYRVVIRDDVYKFLENQGNNKSSSQAANTNVPGLTSLQAQQRTAAQFTGGSTGLGNGILVDMSYDGTLEGLLDRLASSLSVSWKFDRERQEIVFYRFDTRVWHLAVTQSSSQVQGTVTNANSSSGGGGAQAQSGSSLTTTSTLNLDAYKQIDDDVKTLLSPDGKESIDPALGTLTVTDTPTVLSRVDEYVHRVNDTATREVFVYLKLLRVQLNRDDQRGIDLTVLRKDLNDAFTYTAASSVTAFGALTGTIPGTAAGGKAPWAGTTAVIKALSHQGRVTTARTLVARSFNGEPVVLQDTQTIGYLQQNQTLVTANAPALTSVTSGSVTVGFSMRLLPQIMQDDKTILMHAWISLSSLDSLQTFGTPPNIIQTPNTSATDFTERFGVNSGQTIIMAGFQKGDQNTDYESPLPDAHDWAAGGQRKVTNNKSVYVLVMTPVVVDHPFSVGAGA